MALPAVPDRSGPDISPFFPHMKREYHLPARFGKYRDALAREGAGRAREADRTYPDQRIRLSCRTGLFPESSAHDPYFFQNPQLLSRSFSGIFSSRPVLFLKSSAAESAFFREKRGPTTAFVGKNDDYLWVRRFSCNAGSIIFENPQQPTRSFFKIFSCRVEDFPESLAHDPLFF